MLRDGQLLFEAKRYREAAAFFLAAVERHPDSGEAAYWLGVSLAALGEDDDAALAALERSARFPDFAAMASEQIGLIHLRAGRFDLAEEAMCTALAERPSWHPAVIGLGWALFGLRRFDEAEEMAEAAVTAAPDVASGHRLAGATHFMRRRFAEAEAAFRRWTVVAPEDATAAYFLARAQVALGRLKDARDELQRAVNLTPYLPRVDLRLARLCMTLHHWAEAEEVLRRLLDANSQSRTLKILLGETLFWRGDHDGLTALMKEVAAGSRTIPRAARLLMARRWYVAGMMVRVGKNLDGLLEDHPQWMEARLMRAHLLIALNQAGDAEALLNDILDDRPTADAPLRLYCELLAAEERIEDAIGRLERRFSHRAGPVDLRGWLALAYVKLGRRQDAEVLLEAVDPGALPERLRYFLEAARGPEIDAEAGAVTLRDPAGGTPFPQRGSGVFAPRLPRPESTHGPGAPPQRDDLAPRSLWALLAQRPGVIVGAMIFDMSQRFAERRLGYLWAIITPLMYMTVLTLAFAFIRHRQPAGMPLPLFILTGLMMWQTFQAIQGAAARIISRGKGPVPRVTFLDALIAATVLQTMTQLCVGLLFILGLIVLDVPVPWPNIPQLFGVLATLYFMSVGFGTLVFSLKDQFPIINEFNSLLNRVMFLSSGIFFSISDLPPVAAQWVWFNPLMHVIELARQSFMPHFPLDDVTIYYPLSFGLFGFLFGILIHRRMAASATA